MLQPFLSTLDSLRLNGFFDQAWQHYLVAFQQAPEHWLYYGARYFPLALQQHIVTCSSELQIQTAFVFAQLGDSASFEALMQAALQDKTLPDRIGWIFQYLSYLPQPIRHPTAHPLASKLQALEQMLQASPLATAPLIASDYHNLRPYLDVWLYFAQWLLTPVAQRSYRERFGRLFQSWLPPLAPAQPKQRQATDPARLVFVINSNSSSAYFIAHMIAAWPAAAGELQIYYTQPAELAPYLRQQRPDLEHHLLPAAWSEMLSALQQAQADLIYFTEIHTDRLEQSFLASHRLAPVQVTSLLSGVTTGLPEMDYYLSSNWLEAENGPAAYNETLLCFERFPAYCPAPEQIYPPLQRQDLKLPATGQLYFCAQSYWKLHPDFDALLIAILRQDRQGWLLLQQRPPAPDAVIHTQMIEARLLEQAPDLEGRLIWLPQLDTPSFFGLAALADILLDPLYMGGGTTSFELLGQGLPIVTWPHKQPMSRITAACYQRLQVTDCIAENAEQYVSLALDLAHSPSKRQAIQARLLAQRQRLFANPEVLTDISQCLLRLAKGQSA